MDQNERKAEYQYLDEVRALLKNRIGQLERKVSGHESDIEQSGYKMWDELTHVIRDFDDVASLTLYDADIARQEDDYRSALLELRNMLSLYRIPYFGRLDFVSDRDGFRERVYVGAHSFFRPRNVRAVRLRLAHTHRVNVLRLQRRARAVSKPGRRGTGQGCLKTPLQNPRRKHAAHV